MACLKFANCLKVKGQWQSNQDFYHFLAKFGFQKTYMHDIEASEGYIFGNITGPTFISSNTSIIYATLALLPRQYFLEFYGNRTVQDKDIACQLMFKVKKKADLIKSHL